MDRSKHASAHRANFKLRKGALHDHFGVSHDKKLTEAQKEEAASSSNEHVRKMGQLALNFDKMRGK